MLTDAPLLYTPSQLALAALRSGCSSKGIKLQKFVRNIAQEAAGRALIAQQQQRQQRQQQQQQQRQQQQQQQQQQPENYAEGALSSNLQQLQPLGAVPEADLTAAVSQLAGAMSQIDQLGLQRAVKHVDQQVCAFMMCCVSTHSFCVALAV